MFIFLSRASCSLSSSRLSKRKKRKKVTFVYRLEETHENVIAAVRKGEMLAATKVKMCGSGKRK